MRKLYALLFIFITSSIFAQTTDLGGPIAWKSKSPISANIPIVTMPGFDLKVIQAEDAINDVTKEGPWRFGYKFETNITVNNSGTWTDLSNGDRIWRIQLNSKSAQTINVIFEDLFIPEGASIYIYDIENTNRVGAYTSRNNRNDGLLGTELVHGDNIIVEYYEPAVATGLGRFKIANIIHGYRSKREHYQQYEKSLNSSGDCQIDVNCPLGDNWKDQIRSVAMIVVGGNGYCTGALINNTCNDATPYFLTANHCTNGANLGNWAFRFNWESPEGTESCATVANSVDPGGPYDQTANGATMLVSGAQADHALIRIDNLTLTDAQNWNLFYAGWNNNDLNDGFNVTSAIGIHHPSGDLKKICKEEDIPYHSASSGAQVWWINSWEQGVTEPGSSGSPLFDQNGRIIGQLYGGAAACAGVNNNGQYDYYGRLGVSWGLGIGSYLAPLSCGTSTTNDGWDPNNPPVADDAGISGINSPKGLSCAENYIPEVILRNYGTNNLTSVNISYTVDGGAMNSYSWNGVLTPGGVTNVPLPSMSSSIGNHLFEVWTSEPNGNPDNDTDSDTTSINFTISEGEFIKLTIHTDCWGYENYWEIVEGGSIVVASGGNTIGIPPGGQQIANSGDPGSYGNQTTINRNMCLNEGCYSFIIYDDYGDGMDGTASGCSVDGDYTIFDESVNVLTSITTTNFGNSEINNFCVTAPCANGTPPTANVVSIVPILSNDGAIDINVSGGLEPYNFLWSGPGGFTSSTEDVSNLTTTGLYNVTITDGNGCSVSINNISVQLSGIGEEVQQSFVVYPNPSNGSFTIQLFEANFDVLNVEIVDLMGRVIFASREIQKDELFIDISAVSDGIYMIKLTENGHQISKQMILKK